MTRSPDFIGIGQQKCGTSWIAACLDDHPQIRLPVKEPHFFSHDDQWQRGMDHYTALFRDLPADMLVGEFSTTYFDHEHALQRMAEHCPNAKILLALRAPGARAISSIYNDIMAGVLPKNTTVTEQLTPNAPYVQRSLYADRLEVLYGLFPKENIHVILLEESKQSPEAAIADLYRFLGVDSEYRSDFLHQTINKSHVPRAVWLNRWMTKTANVLRRYGAGTIVRALKKTGIIAQVHSMNSQGEKPSHIPVPDEVQALFAKDIARVEVLLGKTVSYWKE